MSIENELKRHFVGRLIENKRRIDGRGFDEYRKIDIRKKIVDEKAEGSALVKIGETEVLCGIKVLLAEPWPDTPNEGVMMVGAELVPIASPTFETGPPGEDAVELARVVDRGIRESQMIDLEKLVITEGEKVWMVSIDLHILNHDGNLIDASSFAAVAALHDAWVPKYEDEKLVREKSGKLPLRCTPVSCTFVKVGDTTLLDPNLDEEYAMDTRLTITTTGDLIHAMQKGGGSGFLRSAEVEDMIERAILKYKDINKLLEK